jgi:hypothetical protein
MGLTLVTPQYQQVFAANANIGIDGIHNEYLHAITGSPDDTHLHVGWNPATGAGFYSLTGQGTHLLQETARFTTDQALVVGEYTTWTDATTTYTQLGAWTATDSLIWTEPVTVVTTMGPSQSTVELPASAGVIVYVPDVTTTWTTWTHVALPHSGRTTSGPGLILIAWVRSFELLGQVVQRSDHSRHAAGEERFGSTPRTGSAWIRRPQQLYGASGGRQSGNLH